MKTQHLSVRIDGELKQKLQEAADIMSIRISDITRWILSKHVPKELEKLKNLESYDKDFQAEIFCQ